MMTRLSVSPPSCLSWDGGNLPIVECSSLHIFVSLLSGEQRKLSARDPMTLSLHHHHQFQSTGSLHTIQLYTDAGHQDWIRKIFEGIISLSELMLRLSILVIILHFDCLDTKHFKINHSLNLEPAKTKTISSKSKKRCIIMTFLAFMEIIGASS